MTKKSIITALLVLPAFLSEAQYKSTTSRYSRRSGKTYELTLKAGFITQSECLQPSFIYSFGRDRGESRWFNWQDLEMVLPATYKYKTTYTDYSSGQDQRIPVTVKTKAYFGFNYRYNLGYYLADNTNPDNKVLPFANMGLSGLFHVGSNGGSYVITEPANLSFGYVDEPPTSDAFISFGVNAGVGVLFRISNRFGVKLNGGYTLQSRGINLSELGDVEPDSKNDFYYKSHPYLSAGIRFRVAGRDE